jgi:hypothetical protein
MAGISQCLIPPYTADPATHWAFLEAGIDHIMTTLPSLTGTDTDLPYSKYASLYTVVYNYCFSTIPSNTSEPPAVGRCLILQLLSSYQILTYSSSRY